MTLLDTSDTRPCVIRTSVRVLFHMQMTSRGQAPSPLPGEALTPHPICLGCLHPDGARSTADAGLRGCTLMQCRMCLQRSVCLPLCRSV